MFANFKWIFVTFVIVTGIETTFGNITLYPKELLVRIYERENFTIDVKNFTKSNITLNFISQHTDIVETHPPSINLQPGDNLYRIALKTLSAGHSVVFTTSSDSDLQVDELYVVVNVFKNEVIDIVSQTSGWIYFVSWALSYYPQIYINFKRKSVVGLSFDYLGLNFIGYISFGMFIQSMYFSTTIQEEYFSKNSRGLIPVKVNDVVYNIHGIIAVSFTIFQCIIYDRGNQVISITTRIILSFFGCFYAVLFILRAISIIQWLDFLYYCSYLKLVITILKYIPQAYMNYKRKSTIGWSIGVVILNTIGGICSLGQMIFDSYNYNDWISIFGNPTKFGLGLFTVLFQIIFIVQHYILYRDKLMDTKF